MTVEDIMENTWVVVAESTRARIFTVDTPSAPLVEVETLVHPEGRLHEQEMTSDLPGSDANSSGSGRHGYQDETEPKKQEAINFARQVADRLDKARTGGEMQRVIVVAAPAFLGILRDQLNDQTGKLVSHEIAKNLGQHTPEDIRSHLPEHLPSL
jgi:protein required for attachment to host cells